MLYIGADHRGFALKEDLKRYLTKLRVSLEDFGAIKVDPTDDYVDYAIQVASRVADKPEEDRGLLVCGSGVGMDMVANKFKGVRAALVSNRHQAVASRQDDDANVLVLQADTTTLLEAQEIVQAWVSTEFSGEDRHVRRLTKVREIEAQNFRP